MASSEIDPVTFGGKRARHASGAFTPLQDESCSYGALRQAAGMDSRTPRITLFSRPMSSRDLRRTYHVWFSTKHRKSVLYEEIRETALSEFSRIAVEISLRILAIEAIADHVHLLIELDAEQAVPTVMHRLKGASARTILLRYPELRLDMHTNSFWQKSYGARLVPPQQLNVVRRYIETQDQRPLRHQ